MELIEREQQLRKLADAWSQVRAGKGCIAPVSGEAGIGKTSLIPRFVAKQSRSTRMLWGACDDLFSPQPLGPFLDIAIQIQSNLLQLIRSGADRFNSSSICSQKDCLALPHDRFLCRQEHESGDGLAVRYDSAIL